MGPSISWNSEETFGVYLFTINVDVARRMNRPVSAVSTIRASLIRKGMLYSPSHGAIAYTVPMFGAYMRRTYQRADVFAVAGVLDGSDAAKCLEDAERTVKTRDRVLAMIKKDPRVSISAISRLLKISRSTVQKHVDALKSSVGLVHQGPRKGGRWSWR